MTTSVTSSSSQSMLQQLSLRQNSAQSLGQNPQGQSATPAAGAHHHHHAHGGAGASGHGQTASAATTSDPSLSAGDTTPPSVDVTV